MTSLACPRCRSHVVSDVVHLQDGPTGLYAVTEEPVADYVHECPCGAAIHVTSTRPALRLTCGFVPARTPPTDYNERADPSSGKSSSRPIAPTYSGGQLRV